MVLINYNYKPTDQVDTWSVGFYVAVYVKLSLEFDRNRLIITPLI